MLLGVTSALSNTSRSSEAAPSFLLWSEPYLDTRRCVPRAAGVDGRRYTFLLYVAH
jgi:hypothetical protein